jgi:ribosomal protein L11 methyltransferase
MRWAQITVEASTEAIDAVGNCLNDIGCGGFMVADELVPPQVSGYVPVDDRLEGRLENLGTSLKELEGHGVTGAGTEITLRYVDEDDWANAWKAFYKPTRVGAHLVVTPPWETPPNAPGDITIIMDPGMAFGTGSHPTTRLCLTAIEDYVKPGMAIADIGTGSGILAIAAAKLGASDVKGCDIDPLAVGIAAKNAVANDVAIAVGEELPAGEFDVVVANILADVIIGMADNLIARVKAGGTLIVSGIIDTREADVSTALQARGLSQTEVRREGEWVAIILRKAE